MKRIFFVLLLLLGAWTVNAQTLGVMVCDDDPYTNVRNGVRGKIIGKIGKGNSVIMEVGEVRDGWWRIVGGPVVAEDGREIRFKPSKTGYWIHYSVLCVDTRNYDGEYIHLRELPSNDAASLYSTNEEISLRPLEVKDGWVKVTTFDGKHIGWIEENMLCSNPLTNCC